MLAKMKEKKAHFPPLVGIQTYTPTVEMSVASPQEAENQCTSISSYTKLGNKPKGLWTILYQYLLIHVHGCSSHNSQELKKEVFQKTKILTRSKYFLYISLYFFPSHMQFVLLRTFRNEADDIAKINMKMIAVEKYWYQYW